MFNWLFMLWIFLSGVLPWTLIVYRYSPIQKGKKVDWSVELFGSLVGGLMFSLIWAFSLTCLIAAIKVY